MEKRVRRLSAVKKKRKKHRPWKTQRLFLTKRSKMRPNEIEHATLFSLVLSTTHTETVELRCDARCTAPNDGTVENDDGH